MKETLDHGEKVYLQEMSKSFTDSTAAPPKSALKVLKGGLAKDIPPARRAVAVFGPSHSTEAFRNNEAHRNRSAPGSPTAPRLVAVLLCVSLAPR